MTAFEVRKDNLSKNRFVDDGLSELRDDQIRCSVDAFALTANNITYGVFGDRMGYWRFYSQPGDWGRIPVWGYATVTESKHADITTGDRIYGYFPMASSVDLRPDRVTMHSFTEGSPHRKDLALAYNLYQRVSEDAEHRPENESQTMIFKPLALTAFLIDDLFGDKDGFGAETILVSSASSKTSLSLGFYLRRNERGRIIGLTSESRVDFCRASGCYDEVLAYDAVPSLAQDIPTAYVDMAGNADLRLDLHRHLGDRLVYDAVVGGTHWDRIGGTSSLPGVRPQLFFAPARVEKRLKDWGRGGFHQRSEAAWQALLPKTKEWVRIVPVVGDDALTAAYADVLSGSAPSDAGYICSVK